MTGQENALLESRNKLIDLLKRMFQFDTEDLDFGIYRIMHHKKKEIEKFIEDDLVGAIEKEFKQFGEVATAEVKKRVEEIKKEMVESLGEDCLLPSGEVVETERKKPVAKKYIAAIEELRSASLTQAQVNEVYNQIVEFFSRYYDSGDFLSKRRYGGKDKYVVPYNGEEVMLHWANRDQYYIKTGEYFQNYSFNVGRRQVRFRIREAEVENGNNKGEKRFFVLQGERHYGRG